jgi:hypothetical protein
MNREESLIIHLYSHSAPAPLPLSTTFAKAGRVYLAATKAEAWPRLDLAATRG